MWEVYSNRILPFITFILQIIFNVDLKNKVKYNYSKIISEYNC